MDIFDDSDNITEIILFFPSDGMSVSSDVTTTTSGTFLELSDKDWMPYNFFEYDPLWHKKFAAIKYQMKKMWD